MNKNDLRYLKTEDNLRASFLELLKNKELNQISVKDICALARCSRNTFYLHYSYREDLYDSLLNEVLASLKASFTMDVKQLSDVGDQMLETYVEHVVDGITSTKKTLKILIDKDNGVFEKKFSTAIFESIVQNGVDNSTLGATETNHLYSHYLASALTGFIFYWISSTNLNANEVKPILLQIHDKTMMTIVAYLKSAGTSLA